MLKKLAFVLILSLLLNNLLFSQGLGGRKNAIKTTFLSYMTGSTKLTYERALPSNQSIEITGGYIGVGIDGKHNNPKGGLFRCAHKFILNPNPKYPLDGMYFKSEFAFSSFSYDAAPTDIQFSKAKAQTIERKNSTMGTLMACFGYQWGKKILTLDGFVGIGGALGNECDTYYHHGFILWDFFGTKSKYVSLTFGLKVGIAFGRS